MMSIYILCGVILNMILGAGVWATMDDGDQNLLRWYKSCPEEISWILQPLVLTVWPLGLWLWYIKRKRQDSSGGRAVD